MDTKKEILERMALDIKNPVSKIEGSFTMDNLSAVANELAKFYDTEFYSLIDRVFTDTAVGEDLDKAAIRNHGMKRREATFEEVNAIIQGDKGSSIDENVIFIADGIRFKAMGTYIIGESGILNLTLRCEEVGAGYRIQENSLRFLTNYPGLKTVSNPTYSSGGNDEESDIEFRSRINDTKKEEVGYGNISWYRMKVKSVPGVDRVKIIDLARGLGTIDIVIIANNNEEADERLLQKVRSFLEVEKILGADIQVLSAIKKEIDISASIYLENGYRIEDIRDEFNLKFKEYLKKMDFKEAAVNIRVSYAKVLNVLLACAGVQDVSTLLINKASNSLELLQKEFPYIVNLDIRQVV